MTDPDNKAIQASTPTPPPALPAPQGLYRDYGPLEKVGPINAIGALLKHPDCVAYEIHQPSGKFASLQTLLLGLLCLTAYGLVLGSFSGGSQWLWAPVKLVGGLLISATICFPSLYIFSCLSGIEVRAKEVVLTLLCAITLSSLLLVGLVPVTWVFSTSTDALGFMGTLHLLFWAVGLFFGMRFLLRSFRLKCNQSTPHLIAWTAIFILVCLQMSTTLRPLLGSSEHVFTSEKKFFLVHWVDTLSKQSPNKKSHR